MNNRDFVVQFGCLVNYLGDEDYIAIPDGVTTIGRKVFYQKKLDTIILPSSVKEIESEAFAYTNLRQIKIKGIIQKVGSDAFLAALNNKNDLYGQTPITAFSKKERFNVCLDIIKNINEITFEEEVWHKDMSFIGKNILMSDSSNQKKFCDYIISSSLIFDELLEEKYIPLKDIDLINNYLQSINKENIIERLQEYRSKFTIKTSKKNKTSNDELDNLKEKFTWKFKGVDVVITKCKVINGDIEVPSYIAKRKVKKIASRTFFGKEMMTIEDYCCEYSKENKRKIILPSGIEELDKRSFYCLNNIEVYLPNTLNYIDEGSFVAVSHLVVHIPESIKEIKGEIFWDSLDETIMIMGKTNSEAYNYAVKHNITFIEE